MTEQDALAIGFEDGAEYEWPDIKLYDYETMKTGIGKPLRLTFSKEHGFCGRTHRGNPHVLGYDLDPMLMRILQSNDRRKVS